jgi:hypothetical protein
MNEQSLFATYAAIAAVISACVALVSAIIGPLVSLKIARKQINASILSGNRQEWINTLRNEVSGFVSVISLLGALRSGGYKGVTSDEANKFGREAMERKSKIELLLNPSESLHNELIAAIENALSIAIHAEIEPNAVEQRRYIDQILNKSKTILKQEWVRVKKGE